MVRSITQMIQKKPMTEHTRKRPETADENGYVLRTQGIGNPPHPGRDARQRAGQSLGKSSLNSKRLRAFTHLPVQLPGKN